MNTQEKYIAKYVFGSVTGMKYNLENLLHACNNPLQWQIKNFSLYGYKYIEILDNNRIKFSTCDSNDTTNSSWVEHIVTIKEFWDMTKDYKKHYGILKINQCVSKG